MTSSRCSRSVADGRFATAAAAALIAAALATGCGSDSEPAATSVPAPGDVATQTISTPTAVTEKGSLTDTLTTATTHATTTEVGATTAPATTPASGAGDEEAARVPAVFSAGKGVVTPAEVKVPAYLSIELTGISKDGAAHTIVLSAGADYGVAIPAGGRAQKTLPGLRPGTYTVILDGVQTAARLKVGGEPGP
jgi:hypothetical protein